MLKLRKLEQRIVLDAAGVVDIVEQQAQELAMQVGIGAEQLLQGVSAFMMAEGNEPARNSFDVVLVSNGLEDYGKLVNAVKDGAHIVVYDAASENADEILEQVAAIATENNREIDSLTLLSHGEAGKFMLGKDSVDHEFLEKHKKAFASIDNVLSDDASWFVYSCDVLDNSANGKQLLTALSDISGASVYASDDITGSGGDWVLEGFSGDGFAKQVTNGVLDIAYLEQSYTGSLDVTVNGDDSGSVNVDISVAEGQFFQITTEDHLDAESSFDVDPQDIQYRVEHENAEHGNLIRVGGVEGGELTVGMTFTQAEVDAGMIYYQHSGESATVSDEINLSVTDGYVNSVSTILINVDVTDRNDKPVVDFNVENSSTGTQVHFVEGDAPVALATGGSIVITDEENHQIQSATAYFQGYYNDLDNLAVDVGTSGLVADYNSETGELTLTGVASTAVYEEVLASITYHSELDYPEGDDPDMRRIVRITVTDNQADNPQTSDRVSVIITLEAINDAPVVDTDSNGNSDYDVVFNENEAPANIFAENFTLSDADDTHLDRATIRLDAIPNGSDEQLLVDVGDTGIVATYDSNTGVLRLTGEATIEEYSEVLATVRYENTAATPDETTRRVTVTVRDGDLQSEVAVTNIEVNAANDAPIIFIVGDNPDSVEAEYVEGDDPVKPFSSEILVFDEDSEQLNSAVIYYGEMPDGSDEQYSVEVGDTGLNVQYFDDRIEITGAGSVEAYQQVIESLCYENLSKDPNEEIVRQVQVTVNDGQLNSSPISANISVVAVDDPTVIIVDEDGNPYIAEFIENGDPVAVAPPSIEIIDPDTDELHGARVTITNPQDPSETLSINPEDIPEGITVVYDSYTLEITGTADFETYEQILASVQFSENTEDPTEGIRNIAFSALAGNGYSEPVESQVRVIAVNDLPVINTDPHSSDEEQIGYQTSYTEGGEPVLVTDDASFAADIDSDRLQSVTIEIVNLQDGAAEILAADAGNTGIEVSYDAETGLLTLSGDASESAYTEVLRTVTYANQSADPTEGDRQLRFVSNDGIGDSEPSFSTITVAAVNTAPELDHNNPDGAAQYEVTFTEDQGAVVAVADNFTLEELDNEELAQATVTLVNIPDGADEVLSVDVSDTGLVANYSNGVLTITGNGSPADYQTVLETLSYENRSQDPTAEDRLIQITVNDGSEDSNTLETIVHVEPVNDAPVVDTDDDHTRIYQATYQEDGDPAEIFDENFTLYDVDDTHLESATITIDAAPDGTDEVLSVELGDSGLQTTYDEETNQLEITGSATIEVYEAVLASARYSNDSDTPSDDIRSVTVIVNDGDTSSEAARTDITVIASNDAPVIAVIPENGNDDIVDTFTEGDDPIQPLLGRIELTDTDDLTVESAIIELPDAPDGDNEQYSVTVGDTGLNVAYLDGRIEITGTGSPDDYQAVIESLRYENISEDPTEEPARVLTITVNDGQDDSSEVTATINIVPVDDATQIIVTENGQPYIAEFTENEAPVAIAPPTSELLDEDTEELDGMRVVIANPQDSSEILAIDEALLPDGVTANFENNILEISGTADLSVYEEILRNITFSEDTEEPTEGLRTLQISVLGENGYGEAVETQVQVIATNDLPVINTDPHSSDENQIGYQITYTEGDDPLAVVDVDSFAADIDSDRLQSITIEIVNLQDGALELLSVDVGNTGIEAIYNAETGLLTLSGDASEAEYTEVLQTVTYSNDSTAPTEGDRQLRFVSNDGIGNSTPSYTTITVVGVNTAPELSHNLNGADAYEVTFTEGDDAVVAVSPEFSLEEFDGEFIESATITLLNLPDGDAELLTVNAEQSGLQATYIDGVLSITGEAPAEIYEQVIATLTYQNTSEAPADTDRRLSIVVTDGQQSSDPLETIIHVDPVNDAPELALDPDNISGSGPVNFRAVFVEDGGPIAAVDAEGLQLSDLDDDTLQGAIITLDELVDDIGTEELSVEVGNTGIEATYSPNTGILRLEGEASLADYEQVLRSLEYNNTSQSPIDEERLITIRIFDGEDFSDIAESVIEIVEERDNPNVDLDTTSDGSEYNGTFVENGGPVAATGDDVLIRDIDSDQISGAVIHLTNIEQVGEEFIGVTIPGNANGIQVQYDADSGLLQIVGDAPKEVYEQIISSLTYENISEDPSTTDREITVTVFDSPENGQAPTVSDPVSSFIEIIPINDLPVIAPAQSSLELNPGEEQEILPSHLQAIDPDSTPDVITFTIETPPTLGTILLNGVELEEGDTFTQENINNGEVTFRANDDIDESDEEQLELSVEDDGGDKSDEPALLNISIRADVIDSDITTPADDLFNPGRDVAATVVGNQVATELMGINTDGDYQDYMNRSIDNIDNAAESARIGAEILNAEATIALATHGITVPANLGTGGGQELVQECSEDAVLDQACRLNPSDDLNERIETAQPELIARNEFNTELQDKSTEVAVAQLTGNEFTDSENCSDLQEPPAIFADDFASGFVPADCATDDSNGAGKLRQLVQKVMDKIR